MEQSGVGEAGHLRVLVKNVERYRQNEEVERVVPNDMAKEESNETDPLI